MKSRLFDLKWRIDDVLNVRGAADPVGRVFASAMTMIIVISTVAVVVESEPSWRARHGPLLSAIESATMSVFLLEYALRLWTCDVRRPEMGPIVGRLRYALRPMMVLDFLVLAPYYLPVGLHGGLASLRLLRLARMLRALRLARYSKTLRALGRVVASRRHELAVVLALDAVVLLIAASVLHLCEAEAQPDRFGSVPSSLWCAIVTLTTVGYGDVYPVTVGGRIVTSVLAILGVGLIALPTSLLSAGFLEEAARRRGAAGVCRECGRARDDAAQNGRHEADARTHPSVPLVGAEQEGARQYLEPGRVERRGDEQVGPGQPAANPRG